LRSTRRRETRPRGGHRERAGERSTAGCSGASGVSEIRAKRASLRRAAADGVGEPAAPKPQRTGVSGSGLPRGAHGQWSSLPTDCVKDMNPGNKKPESITEYIDAAPEAAREKLREMLACLRKAAPGAREELKWGAPALSYQRILFTFAAFKHHVALYPTPSAVKAFAEELAEFKTSSSTIQFPLDRPLPLALIEKIAAFRVQESEERDARWM